MYWLAREVDSHYPSIYKMAAGEVVLVNLDTLDRICEALECEVSDILSRKRGKK